MKKLSPVQEELYESMKLGEVVYFMSGMYSYYFRSKGCKTVTATASALLKKGYVEKYDEDWKGHKLRVRVVE